MNAPRPLEIAALDRGHTHLIEANAGTGKTYAIANLCLRYVLEGVSIRELLVVTFTRAATDELRGRIRARLEMARRLLAEGGADTRGPDPFFDALPDRYPEGAAREAALLRLELALYDIHEAPIHTIHGFCQQALADQAFASGQPFELEQADDASLREQVLRDWWRLRTYGADEAELEALIEATGGFEALSAQIEALLPAGAPELHPPAPDVEALARLEKALAEDLRALARLWHEDAETARRLLLEHPDLARNRKDQKPAALEAAFAALDAALQAQPPRLPSPDALRCISFEARVFKKNAPGKADFDRPLFHRADTLLQRLEPLHAARRLHAIEDALRFARHRLREVKTRRGWLTFDDMIGRLHAALHGGDATAHALAERLAGRYPVVLVDEFQDTDPLQYAIFSAIHRAAPSHTLILIGDPKQAIYGFRGGDIFTYMQARDEADVCWSLSTNWRSTPQLIEAVNHLFSGDNPFAYAAIGYTPSQPSPSGRRTAHPLRLGDHVVPALTVQRIPTDEAGHPLSKDRVRAHVRDAVADRIAELLGHPQARIGNARLRPGDIAVLVRSHQEGAELRVALLTRGIRSVSVGQDRIWDTPEADGLQRLLEAALLPEDRALARQALTAPFLGLDAETLHAIVSSPQRWSNWVERLHQVHGLWRQRGLMAGFQALLDGLAELWDPATPPRPEAWLARLPDPERTLTNLLHLAELLQEAARERAGGEALLAWMRHQREHARDEEHVLRLESDEDLVKIATMHASKGLQYPVVFVPYLWHCKPAHGGGTTAIRWHERRPDGRFAHRYRPWFDPKDPMLARADHERLAEDVRLTYVALTRAESHCHVLFGPAGSPKHPGHAGHTAFAWLLSDRSTDLDETFFVAPRIEFAPLHGCPHIALLPPHEPGSARRVPGPDREATVLEAARIERPVRTDWRVGSFSAMTRDVHQATRVTAAEVGDFALAYPAGTRVGRFLHAVLERLDPRQDLGDQLERLVPPLALRHGLDPEQDPRPLAAWMHDVLHTPLDAAGLCLADLDPGRCLHEAPFDFSTAHVECARLDGHLREALPGRQRPALRFETFQGLVTGVIDLIFEHEGRYYLADYKSNLLGRRLEDYAPEHLEAEVAARRYDLQYLLYSLALHRHLGLRLPDYDYARHFGGVYYLFLRAMRPEHGPRYGVFHSRPPAALVQTLDTEIFATAGR